MRSRTARSSTLRLTHTSFRLTHIERPWRKIAPGEGAPHAQAGRWSHAVVFAGGTELHVFNVYGWPAGSPDEAARQSALWVELFAAIAGLGNAPWIAGWDWNPEPYEIWAHVLEPRVGGYLPGQAFWQPICFPHSGEPRALDLLLISRSLAHCVVGYETGQPGQFPVQCGVKFTLRFSGLCTPVPTLRNARSIPGKGEGDRSGDPPWLAGQQAGGSVQQASDSWTRRAEDWLLQRAGIPHRERGPYRGRGEPEKIRRRRPTPRFTSIHGGEE